MKNQHKKHFGVIMMALGLVFVMTATGLTAYNIWDDNRASVEIIGVVTDLINAIPDSVENNPAYVENPEIEMPICEIGDREYIAILDIPALGISLPVMDEWNYHNLRISPCRYSGSVYLNDMVIAAHNYRAHFGNLSRLNVGDKIYLTDVDGNQFEFNVAEVETLMPTEIERMITGDWDLTMFTCTHSGRARVAVRCVR